MIQLYGYNILIVFAATSFRNDQPRRHWKATEKSPDVRNLPYSYAATTARETYCATML